MDTTLASPCYAKANVLLNLSSEKMNTLEMESDITCHDIIFTEGSGDMCKEERNLVHVHTVAVLPILLGRGVPPVLHWWKRRWVIQKQVVLPGQGQTVFGPPAHPCVCITPKWRVCGCWGHGGGDEGAGKWCRGRNL